METQDTPIVYVCGTCGEHLEGAGAGHSCAAPILALRADRDRYRAALEYIRDHGNTHDAPCWALHQGDCAEVMQEVAKAVLA